MSRTWKDQPYRVTRERHAKNDPRIGKSVYGGYYRAVWRDQPYYWVANIGTRHFQLVSHELKKLESRRRRRYVTLQLTDPSVEDVIDKRLDWLFS